MKIEVDDREILEKFKQIANDVPKAAEDMIANVGAVALTEARNNVPVDTGALKGSITLEVEGGDNPVATVGSNLEYAPYVEYGTSSHTPQPFMEPAKKIAESKMSEIMKAVLDSI